MTSLPVYKSTTIQDGDYSPCEDCVLAEDWHSGLKCKQVAITRYDIKGTIVDPLDPVELLVIADPPTAADERNGEYWSDPLGKEILRSLKDLGMKSFAIVPAVRCYPGAQIDHFVLKKKYKNAKTEDRKTALDIAKEAVSVPHGKKDKPYCATYTRRANAALRPRMTLAIGALAAQALSMSTNVRAMRSKPLHPKPGLAVATEGTVVTWDRAQCLISPWSKNEMFIDIDEKVPNLRRTGYASPRGDESNIEITVLDKVHEVEAFVNSCLDPTNKSIKKSDFLCFDFETAGLAYDKEKNRLLNVGFTWRHREDESTVIPFAHPETPFSPEQLAEVYRHMARLFRGKGARFFAFEAHNAQFETAMVKVFFDEWIGEVGKKPILDTMILAYLLDETRRKCGISKPYSLNTLAREFLGWRWYEETQIKSKRNRLIEEPLSVINQYVGFDSAVTARLNNQIMDWMGDEGSLADLLNVAVNIYSPAILYTIDMTLTGQTVDEELLLKLRAKDSSIVHRLAEIREAFYSSDKVKKATRLIQSKENKGAGGLSPIFKSSSSGASGFNMNSSIHQKVLFADVCRLRGARESVDKKFQELYKDREPLVGLFQEYQQLSKLDSAYLAPLAEYVQQSPDGRVHPQFNLTNTETGRLSASNPNCYDEETEILTRRGWVPFPELTEEDYVAQWWPDTDSIDFVIPDDVSTVDYNGELISIQNQHIDLVVTPNHRCPVIVPKKNEVKEFLASDYPGGSKQFLQLNATYWGGGDVSLSEAEVALICAAQADGSWRKDVKQGAMEWTFHKERKTKRLKWALGQLDAPFTNRPKGEKGRRIYASAFNASLGLVEGTIGKDKRFKAEWVLSLDRKTLDMFVDEINFWDGCYTRNNQYTSVDKKNTDAVQIALSLSRIRATVNERVGYNAWTIHQTNARQYSWTTNIVPTRVRSTGTVYCVSVPSSYVVVRRGGKVSICGQTQQIPRGDTRDKKQIKSLYTVPADKIMVQLDFSQAEVRWLGIMSGDENLAARYQKAADLEDALRKDPTNKELQKIIKIDGDLHMSTAIDMYGLDPSGILDKEGERTTEADLKRQAAKAVCFGLIYGKHAKSLAKDLGISDEEAYEAVDKWMAQFPWAAQMLNDIDDTIADTCIAKSPFGRWRRLPEARALDRSVQNRAKRQARNTPIQAAASDFCIFAAAELRLALRNHPDPRLREQTKLINTVHDSVAAEVPTDTEVLLEYMRIAERIFTDPNLIKKAFGVVATVPLKVDFDIGLNWGNVVGVNVDEEEVSRVIYNTEVLRAQPAGTLLKDLKGTGLLRV